MLTAEETARQVFLLADKFNDHMREKDYAQAKHCYETARTVALFIQMDEDKLLTLFGSRQTDPPAEGLFREEKVLRAYEECDIIRRREEEKVKRDYQRRYGMRCVG